MEENSGKIIQFSGELRVGNGGSISGNIDFETAVIGFPIPFGVCRSDGGVLYFNFRDSKIPLGDSNLATFNATLGFRTTGTEETVLISGRPEDGLSTSLTLATGEEILIGGTIVNPEVRMQRPGTLFASVSLSITDSLDNDTPADQVFTMDTCGITVPNRPPVADLRVTQDEENPLRFTFDASRSEDPDDGQHLTYTFDLGDGNIIRRSEPVYTHTYSQGGVYNYSLLVEDGVTPETDQDESYVTGSLVANQNPEGYFEYTQNDLDLTLRLLFIDSDPDQTLSFDIDWGDGSPVETISETDPGFNGEISHTYSQDGTYTIVVAASDGQGGNTDYTSSVRLATTPAEGIGADWDRLHLQNLQIVDYVRPSDRREPATILADFNPDGSQNGNPFITNAEQEDFLHSIFALAKHAESIGVADPSYASYREVVERGIAFYIQNETHSQISGGSWPYVLRACRLIGQSLVAIWEGSFPLRFQQGPSRDLYLLAVQYRDTVIFLNIINRPGNVRAANLSSRLRAAALFGDYTRDAAYMDFVVGKYEEVMEKGQGRSTQGVPEWHYGITTTGISFCMHNTGSRFATWEKLGGQSIGMNYGVVFIDELGWFLSQVAGTRWEPTTGLQTLAEFIENLQYFVYNPAISDGPYRSHRLRTVRGRNSLWFTGSNSAAALSNGLNRLIDAGLNWSPDQLSLLNRLEEEVRRPVRASELVGAIYDWTQGLFVTSNSGVGIPNSYRMAFRLLSDRADSLEQGIGYSTLNFHQGESVEFLREGDEMDFIPIGDMNAFAMVTAEDQDTAGMPSVARTGNNVSLNPFGGGVLNGRTFVGGYQLDKLMPYSRITANLAAHIFDDSPWIFTGSSIRLKENQSPRGDIRTTLSQEIRKGEITYDFGAGQATIAEGVDQEIVQAIGGAVWVHHNNVGYVIFPQGAHSVRLVSRYASGTWSSKDASQGRSSVATSQFLLQISYGNNPTNEGYVVAILPFASVAETQAFANNPFEYELDFGYHMVENGDVYGLVDFEGGNLFSTSGSEYSFSYRTGNEAYQPFPVAAIANGSTGEIHLADPAYDPDSGQRKEVRIEVDGAPYTVNLPYAIDPTGQNDAGGPVTVVTV